MEELVGFVYYIAILASLDVEKQGRKCNLLIQSYFLPPPNRNQGIRQDGICGLEFHLLDCKDT